MKGYYLNEIFVASCRQLRFVQCQLVIMSRTFTASDDMEHIHEGNIREYFMHCLVSDVYQCKLYKSN